MADIRIKDLTSPASSTASDDFIAVDGTTNGTRKLNAFSPTFGGNATVTGNLTVNTALSVTNGVSANELTCTGGYAVLRGFGGSADTGALYLGQSTNNNFISSNLTTMASYIANTAITSTVAAGFRVLTTTASTSTSSGALVVSGGVGVAGNIWTGGQVNLAATSVEASTGINFGVALAASRDIVFFGDGTRGGMLRGYHDGSNIARLGFGYWASSGDTYTSVIDITGSATTSSQLVAIAGTAGSTSTTSGALTVAGGMGVAEAVNAGTFFGLVDGVTAPATGAGYARIYVDSADGDLKVKFGDGTVKTIATDS